MAHAAWQGGHPSVRPQTAGAPSLRAIAAGVNERKIPADGGTGGWFAVQVMRVMERANIPAVAAMSDNSDRWIETAD